MGIKDQLSMTAIAGYDTAPKASFTSLPVEKVHGKGEPGPGQYGPLIDSEKDKFPRSASWSFTSRGHEGGVAKMPGPGQYHKPGSSTRSTQCAVFTTEDRWKVIDYKKTPPPGTYLIKSADSLQFSFGGKPEGGPRLDKCPGPNDYAPNYMASSSFPTTRKVGFGSSSRPAMVKKSDTPGPGAYNDHETFKNVLKRSGGFSIKGRHHPPAPDQSPGPAAAITQFK